MQNPINLVDPDGRAPSDWIIWFSADGSRNFTYDSSIKNVEQANQKGYNNYNSDVTVASSIVMNISDTEKYLLNPDGIVSDVNGKEIDIDDQIIFSSYGTISENKGIMDAFGDFFPSALQNAGDSMQAVGLGLTATVYGAPIGVPLAKTGNAFSLIGTGLELTNDYFEGKWNWLKFGSKVTLEAIPAVLEQYGGNSVKKFDQQLIENMMNLIDRFISTDENLKKL